MTRLILMRHAKTEPWFHGVDDTARALTDRGFVDAQLVAIALSERGMIPDLALVSTARRARETWTEMAKVFPQAERQLVDSLYLAAPEVIMSAIGRVPRERNIIVIGHNPGMHQAALDLIRGQPSIDPELVLAVASKFPTAAAAVFESEDAAQNAGWRLVEYLQAKTLRLP